MYHMMKIMVIDMLISIGLTLLAIFAISLLMTVGLTTRPLRYTGKYRYTGI